VLRPYLYLAILVSLMVLAVNAFVLPQSMRTLKDYITQVRTDIISQVAQPGQFTSVEKGLTFHIRDKSQDGELLGLMVHDERNPKQVMTYLAERGRILQQNGGSYLIMYAGHIHRQTEGKPEVNIISFESYLFDVGQLAGADTSKGSGEYKPRELFLDELMFPNKDSVEYRKSPGKFRAELHERISSALYPILFVMLAVLHLGYARTTREGRMESVVTAFIVAALLRVGGLAATNLAAKQAWAVAVMYGIPIMGIVGVALMLAFNIKPLKFPSISIKLPRLPLGRRKPGAVPGSAVVAPERARAS
jgi:lipopolysaccharide export system permease protein